MEPPSLNKHKYKRHLGPQRLTLRQRLVYPLTRDGSSQEEVLSMTGLVLLLPLLVE